LRDRLSREEHGKCSSAPLQALSYAKLLAELGQSGIRRRERVLLKLQNKKVGRASVPAPLIIDIFTQIT